MEKEEKQANKNTVKALQVTVGDAHLNQNKNQKMSLKEVRRAGQSSGRKAAVRDEVLPSQQPLTKPTRDVSASNRSHSLTHEQPLLFPSQRRLMLDRDPDQMEFEKQANVVYSQQFRMLGKLLGNQGMDFQELREKVEGLVLADRPHHDPVLLQRIHTLQKELARKNTEVRSSQSLPPSQEYLRGLETELGRKSKIISDLGESVPREAFEEVVRGLQAEIDGKSAELKIIQDQAQEARLKAAGSVSLLEEELIRQKQTIQKLTFELDSQKRRAQNAVDDVDRLRRRQKELSASLQSEGKATYQGLTYSSHALLLQLQARDQQLAGALNEQQILQTELISLRKEYLQAEELLAVAQQERRELQGKLQYVETQRARLIEEIQTVTHELRNRSQAVGEVNQAHQMLMGERERIEDELRIMQEKLRTAEGKERESRSELTRKIAEDEQMISNLTLHLEQSKRAAERASQEVRALSDRNQQLQNQLSEWNIAVHSRSSQFHLKQQEVEYLRRLMEDTEQSVAQREEEMRQQLKEMMERLDSQARREAQITQQLQLRIAKYDEQIHSLEANLANEQQISKEIKQRYEALSSKALKMEETIRQTSSESSQQYTLIQQKHKEVNQLHQQIEQLLQEKQILLVRIDAFQQQKYVLMGRLEESESIVAEATAKGRSLQEAVKGRTALQAEISSRQADIQQLRRELEEVSAREALMQAELEQRQQQTKQAQEEWKRQQQHYQQELVTLTRFSEELQQNLEQERQHHQRRNEEEARVREELERELQSVKNSLREAQVRMQEGHRTQEELKIQTQKLHSELGKAYEEEKQQGQRLLQDNNQLRVEKQQLTTIIQQLNQHLQQEKERNATVQQRHHSEIALLQSQIAQLHTIIDDLKTEKEELEREIQALRKSNQNELASLTFQNFEGELQTHQIDVDYKTTIENLQKELQEAYHREEEAVRKQQQAETRVQQILQREEQWRREEEQRVQLSYSHTLQSAGLLGSLESQRQWLQNENHRLEQELIESKNQFIEKEKQLIEIANDLQSLRERLEHDQRALQEQESSISLLHTELEKEKNESSTNRQKALQWQEICKKKEAECTILKQKFDQYIQKISQQQQQLIALKGDVERMIVDKEEKQALANQLSKVKIERERATQEIASLKQQIEVYQIQVMELEKKAEGEHNISKIEAQRRKEKESKEDEFQEQRILSRLSKRSKLSEEEGVSKGSSDGELSRRILNDPSKISGQESKFANHLLVFQNSKIHVQREAVAESTPEQIKEQRQEESVLSKQQLENRTPESSHRQINTTHFDRETSKRDNRDSPRISDKGSIRESQRYSAHSLTSVRQAEEGHEGSRPSEKQPHGEQKQKHEQKEEGPKGCLPQQSSRKTISNPNESKQSIPQQEPQRQAFSRNSQQVVPIYVARPSAFQPQERRENSQSQSGSKTKVRISYGQPSEKSIQIKRREPELAGSRASNASVHSNQAPVRDSINQVSPIQTRNQAHHTTPSILSTQRRENLHSRPSIHNDLPQPSESIINRINQASRPSTDNNTHPQKIVEVRLEGLQQKKSSPTYIQPRIDNVYSPRHSTPITFNHATTRTQPLLQDSLQPTFPLYATQPLNNTPSAQLRLYQSQREGRKEELTVPGNKIVMRSVIGGKRNSLLNDTATFGKNSQKTPLNQTFTESNGSGIDVLQMDWMEPCCKNN